MPEVPVIIHRRALEKWAWEEKSPQKLAEIQGALKRIADVIETTPPDQLVQVEESPDTGFASLPQQVGPDNSARLFGMKAQWCLKIAREVLEEAGIPVVLDQSGAVG